VQWVIEAYALLLGGPLLVRAARMGDQFGRKRTFLFGLLVFTLASIACGLATSSRALIMRRAVQGAGAAFLVPGALPHQRPRLTQSGSRARDRHVSGFSSITAAIGPVAGGWLIEHVSWRAIFFLNVPLAAIVIVLSLGSCARAATIQERGALTGPGAALAVGWPWRHVFGFLEWSRPRRIKSIVFNLDCGRHGGAPPSSSWSSAAAADRCCAGAVPLADAHARQPADAILYGARSAVRAVAGAGWNLIQALTACNRNEAGRATLLPFPT